VEMAHNSGQLSDAEYVVICKCYDWIQRNIDMHLDLIGKCHNAHSQAHFKIQESVKVSPTP
jgi:hypothetical protein